MTIGEIRELLRHYDDNQHVCLTQREQFAEAGKYEVSETYLDVQGVVNIVAGKSACRLAERDPQDSLRQRKREIRQAKSVAEPSEEGGKDALLAECRDGINRARIDLQLVGIGGDDSANLEAAKGKLDTLLQRLPSPTPTSAAHPLDSVIGTYKGEVWEEVFDELTEGKTPTSAAAEEEEKP